MLKLSAGSDVLCGTGFPNSPLTEDPYVTLLFAFPLGAQVQGTSCAPF